MSLSALTLVAPAAGQAPPSEETIDYFRANCASCHTIGGGRLAGPDLKDVTKRRPREWLVKFVLDPKGTIDSGDPYAQKLLREARGVYMQPIPGLKADRIAKLLELIEAESVSEKPLFAGSQLDSLPLTPAGAARGLRLFRGDEAFASGAPACISCHTVREVRGLGGGRLGPDLTEAYARLEGRKALAAWLASPPSDVMRPIYKKHRIDDQERLALVAFLKSSTENGDAAQASALAFVLIGFFGAALILVLFDFLWRRRFRAVRSPMVKGILGRSTAR